MTKTRFKLFVNQEDIASAIPRKSNRCMIADSVQRHIPWAQHIVADIQTVRFSNASTGRRHIYLTPPVAQRAILDFDSGKRIKPFKLTLSRGYTISMRSRRTDRRKNERTKEWARRKKANPKYTVTRYMPTQKRKFGVRMLTAQQVSKSI